jgi:hypothetical protein
VIPTVILEPETSKLVVVAEAVPYVVLTAERVPLELIVGEGAAVVPEPELSDE